MKHRKIMVIKYKQFYLLAFFLITLQSGVLYSQISIKGNLKNTDGNPVEFASIELLFNSKHDQSALTDSLGNYSMEATQKGDGELLVRMLGYSPVKKELTLRNDTIINFVLQPDSIYLKEVTIIGQKNLIQAKSDRYIINIKGNIETKGKETMDLLKQLPTIYTSNESLNISGKSSVILYINDKIVRLEGRILLDYLNSLPPEIIKSVEIISTPPAQYDAEGNVGIVKIITDKNLLPGWKEYFRAGYIKNNYSSYMLSAYFNYNGKKMFFEGNITNGDYTYLNQSEYRSNFPYQTTATFNPKKWNYSSAQIQTTFGYNFNENSTITFDFQAPFFNKEIINDIENYTSFIDPINNHIDSTIYSNGITRKDGHTYNAEVFFKHLFSDNNSSFTASTAYLDNYTLNTRSFSSKTQIENTSLDTENYNTEGNQNYSILTSKLDFYFPLLSWEVTTGLKFSFINTTSDNIFYTFLNGINSVDSLLYNQFDYTENVQSVYYSMEKNISKWSFKGGIRVELTSTVGKSAVMDESNDNRYIDFFPSLYVSHKFNNGSLIALSYASRFERPPYQYLDPFRWYISKYDYAVGNPFLKPAYIKNIELSFLLNNNFSTKLYYTGQTDKIGQYVILDSLNIMNQIQQADNFMNENSYGINVYKFLKLNAWLETVIQGNLYYSKFRSRREEFSNLNGVGSAVIMNNTFTINKNFQFVLNMEEQIPGLYNYRIMKNYFCLDAGMNYINMKNNFEVRLLFGDVLKTANPEYSYTSGGIKQVYNNYVDTRFFRIVISWRPGNWFNKAPETPTPSNIDEKQRL